MKILGHTLVFSFLILTISCSGQGPFKNSIIGTWELEKTESDSNLDLEFEISPPSNNTNEKKKNKEYILLFQDDGNLDINQSGQSYKTEYILKDSMLSMGNVKYKILTLNKDKLVIKEEKDFLAQTYHYKRSNKKIEPIKEVQSIVEKYPNGQQKIDGKMIKGFKDDVWVEWYENGAVKSVIYYNQEVPYMTIEFDKEGAIENKSWYDLEEKKMKRE